MKRRQYEREEILFREGAPSDSVCKILLGRVQVFKEDGKQEVMLGQIGSGEFVGEMGVIEDRPRSATVRAESDVTVEWIDKKEFLERVSRDSGTALQLLARMSERLASLNSAYSEAVLSSQPSIEIQEPQPPAQPTSSHIRIFADSPELEAALPATGLVIDADRFIVGRTPDSQEIVPHLSVDLALADAVPYRLSRAHFAILRTQEGILVRDLDSQLGTQVNNKYLGRHFGQDGTMLMRGENLIVAGGVDSHFRFRAVL